MLNFLNLIGFSVFFVRKKIYVFFILSHVSSITETLYILRRYCIVCLAKKTSLIFRTLKNVKESTILFTCF